ncbi:LPXTG cell wall anchor domain-containing protein [Streptococcus mitis]|uniref:LPXTG cell wall anchor domain-containing protein n=1 Tax=Streptococcus mitis TaxID=28037 RepID=UPI002FDB4DBD
MVLRKNADVDKAKKSAEAAIKAINSARLPANKVIAKNPTALDDKEQAELKKAIEAVNPPGTKVVVSPDGSALVTLPGKTVAEPLKQEDLTKDVNALDTAGGGNNINRPTDKVIVENPESLTDADKENIKKAVREVNPNAVVTIDDNGTVTVSTPEGNTAGFPASELVRTLADAANPDSGNAGVRKPADKLVGDATNADLQAKATEKLKKLNGEDAKVKYDDEGNATVVLKDGTIATIPAGDLFKTEEDAKKANGGDDINKPNAQTVVEDIAALQGEANKEKLDKVKAEIKAKVEAVNPGAVVVVDDQGNAVVTTPEGKTAVIDADDLIKKPNETSTAKAGNNINNPADRVRVDNSKQLTDPELARIKAAVEAVNPDATVVVDDQGNATVTTKDGKTATIPVADLVKSDADKENVNGGNQVNTPADRVVVDSTDAPLPQEVTDAIKAKIQAVNPDATVVVDEKGNATVTTKDGAVATIPASDLVKAKADLADPAKQDAVNKPADKVVVDPALVDDPNADLSAAKDAIKAAVEAVNPDSTVVVDDKGNATVTTPEGKTVVIPKADLVKKEADKETAKAGNNINKPVDKVVAAKDALTPENIAAIKAKVQAVNPDATVVVDAKGNATVVTPDGQTATIPVTDLVKSPEEAKDEKAGNNVNKPADKVAATKADLADDAKKADVKAKIKAAVKAVNPEGSKVFVDDQGNVTVTTPDGKTATIPVEDLIKDTTQPNAGNKVNTPATKVVVTDPANIKADEDKIKAEILKVNPGATVAFDTEGNATVTTKDGAVATIPAADLAKDAADLRNPDKQDEVKKPADKTLVKKAGKLTPAEKEAIKKEIAKVNRDPKTTIVVDDEGNATVTTPEGKTVVIAKEDLVKSPQEVDGAKAGNNINKPADKVAAAVADLVGPNKDEVKAKIQKAVEAVNPGATVFVDDQGNATVTTPEGNTATISVDDLLKDPTAKESAKAGNEVNTPAERTVVANPAELTDAEKAKITAAIQEVNPEGTKVVFDEAGNATVTVPNEDGTTSSTATIPVSALVKSNAEKDLLDPAKQNPVKKPIDQTVVANKDALTDEDRKAIKAKVAEVNPDATVFVDEKGNATVTTKDGKTAVIAADDLVKTDDEVLSDPKAGNVINKPADGVFVKDGQITDDVKAKIAAKVQRVNPGSTVFVDENGNATVTTPEGKTATIPVKDLTKTDADKAKVNAGNKINSPADRVLVKDRDNLTAEDIQEIEKNILEVNPGATVVFDAKGNATVKNANGDIATIPVEALAKPKADLLKPEKQDLIKKPVDKVLVTDPANLDKEAIKKAVEEVNPGSTVVVDDNGNATITTEDGRSFVIPAKDLVKTAEEAKNAKAGNNINKPADKVVVADPTKPLSQEEKKAIEAKIKEVNPDAKAIFVDDKGNATVTIEDKDGNTETATIPAADLVTSQEEAKQPNAGNKVNTPADKVVVSDPDHLSNEDKAKITEAIKAVNPEAKVAFDDKGNATVTTKDGEVATIPADDLVKTPEEAAKPNAGNNVNTPADKTVVADPNSLTDDEKKAIAAKVAAVNPGATVAVDDKGNATVTVNGKTAVIPAAALTKTADSAKEPNAGNDVVKPADKTVVENPESLTKDEQDAIAAKVAEVNPEAKTVVVDDQGNATVTTKDGKTVVIPAKDLVKTAEEAAKPNAGNDVNTPADKTVLDPNDLEASKKAIEDKVKAVNPGATVVVDDQGNATVTTKDGKVAVIPAKDLTKTADSAKEPNAGNDVVKPADKTVVANPESLTKDEKDAIVAKVKAVNPDATVVVDDQGNATVTPKDGKPVVIPASDLTKSAADAAKPNAGNDVVKPADKTVVANPNALTPKEKEAIAAKVAAVNPGAEVVVDDQGNATVTVNGKTAVIPAADLTKNADAEKAPKAGNDIVKPASKTKVANPDSLTKDEKDAIAAKVAAVNPGSTVVVDDQGNATVTLPNGNTAVIPASDLTKSEKDVNDGKAKDNAVTPASKTKVANPNALTEAEKKAIADKVKAANPGATVVVDDQGNATVVKDGNVSVIPSTDLVKVEDDATKPNGGNDANTPAAKTVVADSEKLKDAEKEAVKKAVEAVNPGSTVVVDDKGNATVTKGDGTVLNIPASDLVIPAEKLADEAKNAKVKTPAIRTLVGNKENLTKDEKDAVKKAIEAVNPGSTVVVDDQGNATVTMPDGSTATISKEQLVKNAEEAKAKNGGNNLDFDLSKVTVANLANITPKEKEKFQFMVLDLINSKDEFDLDAFLKTTDAQGNTVYTSQDSNVTITIDKDGNMKVIKNGKTDLVVNIDEEGNVTIVTKEGKVLAISRDDAFKQRPYVPSNGGGNNSGNGNGTSGNNGATNTDAKVDKAKLEGAIHQLDELFIQESAKLDAETAKEATDLLADAKKVFADPKANQDEVDAMVKRIEDFMAKVAPATDHATPAKDQAAQTSAPATTQAAANASQEAATNTRKAAKELPNTGTADSTVAMVAAAASALLGLGLAGRRRKEDEEA